MASWHGVTGRCIWTWFHATTTDEDWDAYLAHLTSLPMHTQGGAGGLLTVAWQSTRPNATQRQALVELVKSKDTSRLLGHAFVSDSAMSRGVLTAIGWLVSKPYPERAFDRPLDGIAWLASKVPGTDAEKMWRDIEAEVPAAARAKAS